MCLWICIGWMGLLGRIHFDSTDIKLFGKIWTLNFNLPQHVLIKTAETPFILSASAVASSDTVAMKIPSMSSKPKGGDIIAVASSLENRESSVVAVHPRSLPCTCRVSSVLYNHHLLPTLAMNPWPPHLPAAFCGTYGVLWLWPSARLEVGLLVWISEVVMGSIKNPLHIIIESIFPTLCPYMCPQVTCQLGLGWRGKLTAYPCKPTALFSSICA